jgi:hypothetical protein
MGQDHDSLWRIQPRQAIEQARHVHRDAPRAVGSQPGVDADAGEAGAAMRLGICPADEGIPNQLPAPKSCRRRPIGR